MTSAAPGMTALGILTIGSLIGCEAQGLKLTHYPRTLDNPRYVN